MSSPARQDNLGAASAAADDRETPQARAHPLQTRNAPPTSPLQASMDQPSRRLPRDLRPIIRARPSFCSQSHEEAQQPARESIAYQAGGPRILHASSARAPRGLAARSTCI
eukprot:4967702-Pyramimonas_sp.AAC.1